MALWNLPEHVVLHLVKQEFHLFTLANGHIDLHGHIQLAEHMPNPDEPPLQDHMHTHLQHLPPAPHSGESPTWVPDDVIYNDTGRAYNYPQPLRTMAHIRSSHADNTLITHLQHELQMALYFSALYPSLFPVHLQKRRALFLLEQLPFLNRVAPWYSKRGIHIPPRLHHMPVPPTTAGNSGPFQTMPTGPVRRPPGHVETGRDGRAICQVGPGDAICQRGTAPDADTIDQGSGATGGGTPRTLPIHCRQCATYKGHSEPHASQSHQTGRRTTTTPRPVVYTSGTAGPNDQRTYYHLLIYYQPVQPTDSPCTPPHSPGRL